MQTEMAQLESLGIQVRKSLGLPGMFALDAPSDMSQDELSSALAQIPGFRYVIQDQIVFGSSLTPNDLRFAEQYALENTGQYQLRRGDSSALRVPTSRPPRHGT